MDSVFLRENRGHLSENLSTKNYSFGAKMRIIRRLPPNGSHPLRIPRNTRAQVKLAKSLAWPKEWGPCCVAFGRAFGSHPRGREFESLQVHHVAADGISFAAYFYACHWVCSPWRGYWCRAKIYVANAG